MHFWKSALSVMSQRVTGTAPRLVTAQPARMSADMSTCGSNQSLVLARGCKQKAKYNRASSKCNYEFI